RHRLAMKVAAGENVAFCVCAFPVFDEDERVIHGGVRFDFENFAAMAQRIAHGSVHLRNTAQRISILDASTIAMRLSNLAAFEQSTEAGCTLTLARVRSRVVDALVRCEHGASASLAIMAAHVQVRTDDGS